MSFYKREGIILSHGDFIINGEYQLNADDPNDIDKEIDGWKWFDSEEEAKVYYGIE